MVLAMLRQVLAHVLCKQTFLHCAFHSGEHRVNCPLKSKFLYKLQVFEDFYENA